MEFVEELAACRQRTTLTSTCRGLIILGTGQKDTAALILGTLPMQRVAFLLTDQTRNMPQEVARLLGADVTSWLCPPGDHSTTLDVYKGVKQVLEAWADLPPQEIAVDVTGGLKPMSLGLEKAAHVLGLQTFYVESDYDSATGRFIPGTQRVVMPPDPYDVFGDLEAEEARRLFAAHDYLGAQRIFARLADRVDAPLRIRYASLAQLAAAYAAWDVFDLPQARRLLTQLDLVHLPNPQSHECIRAQQAAIQTLDTIARSASGSGQQALQTLASVDAVLPLLGSLYANARRREAQGRYDMAALLHYRCLELLSQHRLARYDVLTEQPDWEGLRQRQRGIDAAYRSIEHQVGFTPRGLPRSYSSIALFQGYMLLAALNDELVRGYPIKQIRERSKTRNKSILAHGYQLITEAEYRPFVTIVEEMINRFFILIAHDRKVWHDAYTFISLG